MDRPPPADHEQVVAGWIREGNLRPFCRLLSELLTYDFDDLDWQAVQTGLLDTDSERSDGWYSYPLCGRREAVVWFALEPGAGVVSLVVRLPAEPILYAQVEVLVHIAASYGLAA